MICLNHFLFHYLKKNPSSQRHSSTSNGRVLMVIGINSTLGEKRSGNVFYLILLEITLHRKLCSDYHCWPLQSGIDDQRGTGGFLFYTSPCSLNLVTFELEFSVSRRTQVPSDWVLTVSPRGNLFFITPFYAVSFIESW